MNGSKVVAKISICHAVPWGQPFCLQYPGCNSMFLKCGSCSGSCRASTMLFYGFYRCLDSCKTILLMSILRNLTQIRETSWDKMSNGNLVWNFILRALSCHNNLNLLSNHIMAIIK